MGDSMLWMSRITIYECQENKSRRVCHSFWDESNVLIIGFKCNRLVPLLSLILEVLDDAKTHVGCLIGVVNINLVGPYFFEDITVSLISIVLFPHLAQIYDRLQIILNRYAFTNTLMTEMFPKVFLVESGHGNLIVLDVVLVQKIIQLLQYLIESISFCGRVSQLT